MSGRPSQQDSSLHRSHWVIVTLLYCIYLRGSRWISWQHTGGIVGIPMRKPGAFLFSKAPLNLGSVQNFFFFVKSYTIIKRITFMLLRSWIILTVTFLREVMIHMEDNKDAISITWMQLAAILTNVNGGRLSWKIIRMTLQCAPTGTIQKT